MAYKQQITGRRSVTKQSAMRSLVNALTTASSTSTHQYFTLDQAYQNWALQVKVTGASTKVDKFILEASIDGTNFATVAGSTLNIATAGNGGIVWVTSKPASHIRVAWVAKATTKTVNAYIAAGA